MQLVPKLPVEEIYTKIILLLYLICTDQTGRFPVRSKSSNNYIMVMYDYDANAIFGQLIKDRVSTTLQNLFLLLFQKIKLKGYKPSIIRLDNEISKEHFNLLENLDLKI